MTRVTGIGGKQSNAGSGGRFLSRARYSARKADTGSTRLARRAPRHLAAVPKYTLSLSSTAGVARNTPVPPGRRELPDLGAFCRLQAVHLVLDRNDHCAVITGNAGLEKTHRDRGQYRAVSRS